ncbi:MAG: class I adenylate-forming enzyme family protein [Planctomycetota bacterium]
MLHELVAAAAEQHRQSPALRDDRRTLSFAALQAEVARAASALALRGVQPGDRVALLLHNRCEVVVAVLAASALRALAVPLNWRLRPRELQAVLADVEPTALVAEPALLAGLAPGPGCRARLLCTDAAGVPASAALRELASDWEPWDLALAAGSAAALPTGLRAKPGEDDVVLLMSTSGTTGLPKCAQLSQRNLVRFLESWRRETSLAGAPDFVQIGTPLFHVGGLVMTLCALSAGAGVRLQAEFDPQRALAVLVEERCTHALFVPAMLRWMLLDPSAHTRRFPDLRLIVYGAAPIPVPQLEEALSVFGCDFLQGYGLTESTGALTVLRPADHRLPAQGGSAARLASAGQPLDCCEVQVVDRAGQPVPVGVSGEVVARGDNLCQGYWRRPQETQAAWAGGWFHTGDLATRDAEGYLTLVDRLKDLIVVGGENVAPREVEEALRSHPRVKDIAVLGIPHGVWGEEVLALVVPDSALAVAGENEARQLIAHARALLANYKCPTRIEWREALPRGPTGKLDKRALREPYWAGRERRL